MTSMPAEPDHADLRAAELDLARALEASDPLTWVDHYTDDAVFVGPGAPAVQGREALLAMAGQMSPLSAVSIVPLRTEAAGDVAAVYVRGSWTSGANGSSPSVSSIRGILVWRRGHDGRWRVAQELLHADPEA